MSARLRLPSAIYDDGLDGFVSLLGDFLARLSPNEPMVFDFQPVSFYVPGAITALLATLQRGNDQGYVISLANVETAPAFTYLQRVDFFRHCGIDLPESFYRHDSSRRFVPLRRVDRSTTENVDSISRGIAACLFPEQAESDDPEFCAAHDLVTYATSELLLNAVQHARAPAFVMAQSYQQNDSVRIAVADYGIGIRGSFEESRPDFWNSELDDLDAVQLALKPTVSSKAHVASGWGEAVNAGVGLSILKELTLDTDGIFTLASHTAFHQTNHQARHPFPSEYRLLNAFPGTLCTIQIFRNKLVNEQAMLYAAKQRLGLIDQRGAFDNLFES